MTHDSREPAAKIALALHLVVAVTPCTYRAALQPYRGVIKQGRRTSTEEHCAVLWKYVVARFLLFIKFSEYYNNLSILPEQMPSSVTRKRSRLQCQESRQQ